MTIRLKMLGRELILCITEWGGVPFPAILSVTCRFICLLTDHRLSHYFDKCDFVKLRLMNCITKLL